MKYYLDPFGCAKNQVDAENMMALLEKAGWAVASDAENADLIIVNSCGFIESAKRESINAVLGWRKLYPDKKILLAGCLAQRYAADLARDLPEADGLFGTDDLSGLVSAAEKATGIAHNAPRVLPGRKKREPGDEHGLPYGRRPLLSLPGSAYVKISEGCDNRCAYCAIPLIRGSLRSRAIAYIAAECEALLGRGIKELCLIGQDTGSYGRDLPAAGQVSRAAGNTSSGLPALLETLSGIKGNFRVRLLYIHPDNFPLPVLDIMEKDERILPYFDIPFQHASKKILKAMNRRGNAETYLDLVQTLRSRIPGAVIRSTFLTGFPGETAEDFELLLDFQKKASLDWLGCFAYSREDGTPAWNMKGRVAKKTALERKRVLEERQIPITEKQMDRLIGGTFDVLVEEEFSSDGSTLYLGRLPCHAPEVDGAAVITGADSADLGALLPCRVIARAGFDLRVRLIAPAPYNSRTAQS